MCKFWQLHAQLSKLTWSQPNFNANRHNTIPSHSNYNSSQITHFTHQKASSHSILHKVQVLHNILRAQKSRQNYSNCGLKICLVHWMLQWPPGPRTKMWLPQTNADGTNWLFQSKMSPVTWKANPQLVHSKQKTNLDLTCLPQTDVDGTTLLFQSKTRLGKQILSWCFQNGKQTWIFIFQILWPWKWVNDSLSHHTWYEQVKSNTGSSFSLSQSFRYLLWAAANAQIKVYSDHLRLTNGWQLIDMTPSVRNCRLSGEANWHLNEKSFYRNKMDSKEEAERITQTLHFPNAFFFSLHALDTQKTT